MTISAKVVLDSISEQGIRLITLQCRYPKFIHGEAKTHRVMRIGDRAYEALEEVGFMDDPNLSRNASSSRAIPVERLIKDVLDDPAMPVYWGKNQAGMQAAEELTGPDLEMAKHTWLLARDEAVRMARMMVAASAHKQLVNRIIEPWCHINVVVTATEWDNFFALRRHPAAQPEMRALAEAMRDAVQASVPGLVRAGGWHLPYYDPEIDGRALFDADLGGDLVRHMIRLSVARCARVSYLTQGGKTPSIEEDLRLYDRLVGGIPLHASPAEHQATPDLISGPIGHLTVPKKWVNPNQHGNLFGWRQYRKMLPNENAGQR